MNIADSVHRAGYGLVIKSKSNDEAPSFVHRASDTAHSASRKATNASSQAERKNTAEGHREAAKAHMEAAAAHTRAHVFHQNSGDKAQARLHETAVGHHNHMAMVHTQRQLEV